MTLIENVILISDLWLYMYFTFWFMCSWQEKQRSKVKEKLEKCVKEKLVDFCDVLNIPINKASVKKARIYEPISLECVGFFLSQTYFFGPMSSGGTLGKVIRIFGVTTCYNGCFTG